TSVSRAFLQSRQGVQQDKQALEILEDYQRQLQKIAELDSSGKPIEPEDKHMLTELQQKVASNETLKCWMKAQADFSELMGKVNKAITEPFQDTQQAETNQGAAQQAG
ncbi:MAG: YlbF family regulator, partial [Phycisphaerae bacterium]|nr:YlbF family regulator [Phycisphaerae bacterium]